jgi:DNA-binding LacI/PurR family transcriptional regulator
LAGVNQSTVSLVLSGKAAGRVSVALQDRVRTAATQLRYQPSNSARALRSGQARAIGLLVPDITNPFVGLVMHGAQEAAWQQDLAVMLMESGDGHSRHRRALAAMHGGLVDGTLFFAAVPGSTPRAELGPTVLIEVEKRGFPSVLLDSAQGMSDAVSFLLRLGHRRIAYLGVGSGRWTFERRKEQWRSEMRAAGLNDLMVADAPSLTLDAARSTALQLLHNGGAPITAIMCADDILASGALWAARELGLRVPDDLSLVGFAGTLVGQSMVPALTTVVAPAAELGASGVELLTAVIAGKKIAPRTVLPVRLEIRDSVGSAP